MMTYPGDPAVAVAPALRIPTDGVEVARLTLGSHSGTHVDAPAHTIAGGRTMADVDLHELFGEAAVLRAPHAGEGEPYGLDDLEFDGSSVPDRLPPIVLIDTGWAQEFGHRGALNHPWLLPRAAEELWSRGMRVLGVDTLSPDPTDDPTSAFPVHEAVLGRDGLIVENLRGLEHLPPSVKVGIFPLRYEGDGAPVRAVAFTDGPRMAG